MKISDAPQYKGQLRWIMCEVAEPVGKSEFYTPRSVSILQVAEYPSDGSAFLVWVDVEMALEP
jgi:hypothetical protein